MNVSIKSPIIATTPCSCGILTFAMACACGVDPIPASFEKRPLFAPWLMAVFNAYPALPPITDSGLKAHLNIIANVWGMLVILDIMIAKQPAMYSTAIMGTSFSVTDATLWIPPMNINAAIAVTAIPIAHDGVPNAF